MKTSKDRRRKCYLSRSKATTLTSTILFILLLLLTVITYRTYALDNDEEKVQFITNTGNHKKQFAPTTINNDETRYIDVNASPIHYDGAQLWRIHNISKYIDENLIPLTDVLEYKYGGNVWKENVKFLDVSITKDHLKRARQFLKQNHMAVEILNDNVQKLIDDEAAMGVNLTSSDFGKRTRKSTGSGMHFKDYHDLDTIYSFMREVRGKYPNICRLYSIGKTVEGRDLKVLSPATVTFILYKLLANWTDQPDYIRHKTWYIMPVMNPDGYVYSRRENRLWRKNRSPSKHQQCYGVDLNRNFDIGWDSYGSSTHPCSDTYRGHSPASELETQAVVKFLTKRKFNLHSYLTFHSYGQLMVYPWAYRAVKVKDANILQRVANTAVQRIAKKTQQNYRAAATYEVLGIAGGGSDDWCRAVLGTPYVYTVELRDRGHYGFILPPDQILETALEGYIIVDTVAQAIN
uniref:Peptidase M14 domain-containing protein n=1 Tax=Glossina palpalis gambiensis TaxID=67801 RepID=A0A1B0AQJ6_9MUSC